MEMNPIQSSNLDAIGYDDTALLLHVRFKSGDTYEYAGVPHDVYRQMWLVPSLGGYLHSHIKPHYPATRINDPATKLDDKKVAMELPTGWTRPGETAPPVSTRLLFAIGNRWTVGFVDTVHGKVVYMDSLSNEYLDHIDYWMLPVVPCASS